MGAKNNAAAEPDRELVIERVFEAPRELVFRAFTEIEMALHWMGPREFPMTYLEGDLRVGGKWRGCLKAADGKELWQGGEWREVVAPERLAFTFGWEQPDGSRGPETLITIALAEQGGNTLMTFRQEMFDTKENRDGHRLGWNSAFDRLAEYLVSF
jgi:uncharacterized protein YndB with AHSA1/START domain